MSGLATYNENGDIGVITLVDADSPVNQIVEDEAGCPVYVPIEGFGNLVRRIRFSNSGRHRALTQRDLTELPQPSEPITADRRHRRWNDLKEQAELAVRHGCLEQAAELWHSALQEAQMSGDPDLRLVHSLDQLGHVYQAMNNLSKAEDHWLEAASASQKIYGDEHPKLAACLNNLAGLYYQQGEYRKGESICHKVLDIFRRSYGDDHPSVGMALNNLGMLYHALGVMHLADYFYERALTVREKHLGPSHMLVLTLIENYINVLEFTQQTKKAQSLKCRLQMAKQVPVQQHHFAQAS